MCLIMRPPSAAMSRALSEHPERDRGRAPEGQPERLAPADHEAVHHLVRGLRILRLVQGPSRARSGTTDAMNRLRLPLIVLVAAVCVAAASSVNAQTPKPPPEELHTAASVRGLSVEEAGRSGPVRLRGVVTFFDEALYSRFLQDDTAGIYLREYTNTPPLKPGQIVEVQGRTSPGEYAPIVIPEKVRVVGDAPLPPHELHFALPDAVRGMDAQTADGMLRLLAALTTNGARAPQRPIAATPREATR